MLARPSLRTECERLETLNDAWLPIQSYEEALARGALRVGERTIAPSLHSLDALSNE